MSAPDSLIGMAQRVCDEFAAYKSSPEGGARMRQLSCAEVDLSGLDGGDGGWAAVVGRFGSACSALLGRLGLRQIRMTWGRGDESGDAPRLCIDDSGDMGADKPAGEGAGPSHVIPPPPSGQRQESMAASTPPPPQQHGTPATVTPTPTPSPSPSPPVNTNAPPLATPPHLDDLDLDLEHDTSGAGQLNAVEADCRASFMAKYGSLISRQLAEGIQFEQNQGSTDWLMEVDVVIPAVGISLAVRRQPPASWRWQHMTRILRERGLLQPPQRTGAGRGGTIRRRDADDGDGAGASAKRARVVPMGAAAGVCGNGPPAGPRASASGAAAAVAAAASSLSSPNLSTSDSDKERGAKMDDDDDKDKEFVPEGLPQGDLFPAAAAAASPDLPESPAASCERHLMLKRADPRSVFHRLPENVTATFTPNPSHLWHADAMTVTIGPFKDAQDSDYYVQGTARPKKKKGRNGREGWDFSQALKDKVTDASDNSRPDPERFKFRLEGGKRIIGRVKQRNVATRQAHRTDREHGQVDTKPKFGEGNDEEGLPQGCENHHHEQQQQVSGDGKKQGQGQPKLPAQTPPAAVVPPLPFLLPPLRHPRPPYRPPLYGAHVAMGARPSTGIPNRPPKPPMPVQVPASPAAAAAVFLAGRRAAPFAVSPPGARPVPLGGRPFGQHHMQHMHSGRHVFPAGHPLTMGASHLPPPVIPPRSARPPTPTPTPPVSRDETMADVAAPQQVMSPSPQQPPHEQSLEPPLVDETAQQGPQPMEQDDQHRHQHQHQQNNHQQEQNEPMDISVVDDGVVGAHGHGDEHPPPWQPQDLDEDDSGHNDNPAAVAAAAPPVQPRPARRAVVKREPNAAPRNQNRHSRGGSHANNSNTDNNNRPDPPVKKEEKKEAREARSSAGTGAGGHPATAAAAAASAGAREGGSRVKTEPPAGGVPSGAAGGQQQDDAIVVDDSDGEGERGGDGGEYVMKVLHMASHEDLVAALGQHNDFRTQIVLDIVQKKRFAGHNLAKMKAMRVCDIVAEYFSGDDQQTGPVDTLKQWVSDLYTNSKSKKGWLKVPSAR
ncbi:unnamed protein product [Vitrella brassicaformis CCMP3155]|uniref:Uncharacterized protein n=1 Tax=Vitrella brassicaformis (strain CCMP3155) TaxID=1169540 RepID=A0A0G4FTU9_VITBC|nr:unnamed protein product [Vitrella brassicaformis CCMP3155]|eukprot:CEM18372.1 unnamed protein product [Vitrella brassicaformis CCMP3155]